MSGGLSPDTYKYHHFEVQQCHRSSFFTRELVAFDEGGNRMYLPVTIKNMYRGSEAANDVADIIEKIFIGKTKQECEEMLGVVP